MHNTAALPTAISLAHLRPADRTGWAFAGLAVALTISGAGLSTRPELPAWLAGQVILGAAFVQWFVLLHECGHGTLFRTRRLNMAVGMVAGFFALIPFQVWRRVHQRHHKWTGWQDLDPTTAGLVPRPLSAIERGIVDVCWRYWIPLFAAIYRVTNFWHAPRMWRLFPTTKARRAILVDLGVSALVYAGLVALAGPLGALRMCGLALVLAFMAEDVLLISQHTHIPMGLSGGEPVEPHPTVAQQPFTRSLRLPAWASRLALHFDAHELHHMYPFVPGYRLDDVPYRPGNEVSWRTWVPAARRVPGHVLLFQNRDSSGFDV